MGVPPKHPFIDGISPYKPSIVRYPYFRKPPYITKKVHTAYDFYVLLFSFYIDTLSIYTYHHIPDFHRE